MKRSEGGHQTDEAVMWFDTVYPRTLSPTWPADCKPVGLSGCAFYLFLNVLKLWKNSHIQAKICVLSQKSLPLIVDGCF